MKTRKIIAGNYVLRVDNPKSEAGKGLSVNTYYRVLFRQANGLLTLKNFLMLVPDSDVQRTNPATEGKQNDYNAPRGIY